jgi:hypothetical protein
MFQPILFVPNAALSQKEVTAPRPKYSHGSAVKASRGKRVFASKITVCVEGRHGFGVTLVKESQ